MYGYGGAPSPPERLGVKAASGALRVLVTGSRTWTDATKVAQTLAGHPRGTVFVHGAARGADQLAGDIAHGLGYDVEEYPADWRGKGKRAGIIRNLQMLDTGPDKVIAFWDGQSTGTRHTITEACQRGIPVKVVL